MIYNFQNNIFCVKDRKLKLTRGCGRFKTDTRLKPKEQESIWRKKVNIITSNTHYPPPTRGKENSRKKISENKSSKLRVQPVTQSCGPHKK